jgi:periplasmic protein TonB
VTAVVTQASSAPTGVVIVDPQDRFLAPIDPWLRNAKQRAVALIVLVCLLHAGLLTLLLLRDHAQPQDPPNEVPVEVIVIPPPEPKPQPKKEEPQPKKQRHFYEPPASDLPPAANKEKIERDKADQATASPLHGDPDPQAQRKPVPTETKPAQAAPLPAERTAAPDVSEDKPDAEPLSKAMPDKSPMPTEKQKPAKQAPVPAHDRASLEREFAALSVSPNYSLASRVKPSPVSGGHCDAHASPYLCTVNGLITRQMHDPRTTHGRLKKPAVVVFWIDPHGDLVHYALERTSGFPAYDAAAVSAVRKAAPFPPPPDGQSIGLYWAADE